MFDEVIIVAGDPARFVGCKFTRCVADVFTDGGPLGGIYTGLTAVQKNYALFVSTDLPFLSESFIRREVSAFLAQSVRPAALVPVRTERTLSNANIHDRHKHSSNSPSPSEPRLPPPQLSEVPSGRAFEPLHAIYAVDPCAAIMRACLEAGVRRISRALCALPPTRLVWWSCAQKGGTTAADGGAGYDDDEWALFNVNTPDELAVARRHEAQLPEAEATAGEGTAPTAACS